MNNEFTLWFVRNYIMHLKRYLVNWAIVAASTMKEKTQRFKAKGLKSRLIDNSKIGQVSKRFEGDKICMTCALKVKMLDTVVDYVQCPFKILEEEIKHVGNMHLLLGDLLQCGHTNMSPFEKFMGLQFNMEDCRSTAIEAQASMVAIEVQIKAMKLSMLSFKAQKIWT
jgi:hypothetical protein